MKRTGFEKALLAYHKHKKEVEFEVTTNLGDSRIYQSSYFFRPFKSMPKLEKIALKQAKGNILDIGAGVGSHSLYLQEKGLNVTALEISGTYCEIMRERGVKKVIEKDFWEFTSKQRYDTILLLMDNLGLAKKVGLMPSFFEKLKSLLNSEGQILIDSADLAYMFDTDEEIEQYLNSHDYYGEITYTIHHKNTKDEPFDWLFLDEESLGYLAKVSGFKTDILYIDDYDNYLAKLSIA